MWGWDLEEMAGGEGSGGSWAVFGRGLTCHVLDLSQDQRRRCCETVGPGDEALPGLPAGDGAAGGVRALRVPRQSERAGRPSPATRLPCTGGGRVPGVTKTAGEAA